MRIRIENVTASIKLEHGIDIERLSLEHSGAEVSDGHPMAILRPTEAIAVQIYENGNVISTGSRSTSESRKVICDALDSLGLAYDPDDVVIRDIMASTILDHDINLDRVYLEFGSVAEYNPEWFSGVIVHYDSMGTTGIIYAGGKIVVSGAVNMDLVYDTLESVIGVIRSMEQQ